MAITTRSSVVAITVESTEGTPVVPSAGSEFIPVQDDFSMEPSIEKLENAEVKNSLGKAKGIVGVESPTSSFGLYLKHSGVEGQAPSYASSVLKALFGAETADATEEVTDAGSTTAIIAVTANGADHPRGSALLLKDGVNGYAIRPVHSVSTNDLTLGFEAGAAPAAGVSVGKAVTYSPTNTGLPQTLSIWRYAGSGGAVDMMSGGRVVSGDITAEAGQLINAAYSLEGLEYYFNPVKITSSDNKMDFTDDTGTYAISVAAGMFKDPHALAAAVATAMNAATVETMDCIYSDSTGKYTISTSTSTLFSILWKTGASGSDNTDDHLDMGFSDAADDTASTSYISDTVIDLFPPVTASFDDADPLAAKANQLFIGEADDAICVNASSFSASIATPKSDISSICATSGKSGSVISERTVTISVTALLDQYDADKFRRFRENTETRICYVGGEKVGGNWVAGKCFCFYVPTATISSLVPIEDQEGLVGFTMELETFVDDSGNGEVYLSFV